MTTTFNSHLKSDGESALGHVNQLRLHHHTQANIRERLEKIHDAFRPMTAQGIALIRDVLRFARDEYTKVGHVVPTGGVIDTYKITVDKVKSRRYILATLYYDDPKSEYARRNAFRSRRLARVWAKSVIALGIVDLDFEVNVPRPVEKITINATIKPEL